MILNKILNKLRYKIINNIIINKINFSQGQGVWLSAFWRNHRKVAKLVSLVPFTRWSQHFLTRTTQHNISNTISNTIQKKKKTIRISCVGDRVSRIFENSQTQPTFPTQKYIPEIPLRKRRSTASTDFSFKVQNSWLTVYQFSSTEEISWKEKVFWSSPVLVGESAVE